MTGRPAAPEPRQHIGDGAELQRRRHDGQQQDKEGERPQAFAEERERAGGEARFVNLPLHAERHERHEIGKEDQHEAGDGQRERRLARAMRPEQRGAARATRGDAPPKRRQVQAEAAIVAFDQVRAHRPMVLMPAMRSWNVKEPRCFTSMSS